MQCHDKVNKTSCLLRVTNHFLPNLKFFGVFPQEEWTVFSEGMDSLFPQKVWTIPKREETIIITNEILRHLAKVFLFVRTFLLSYCKELSSYEMKYFLTSRGCAKT